MTAAQLTLDQAVPHNNRPTSRAAAVAIHDYVPRQAGRVLDAIRAAGDHGLTRAELVLALRMDSGSVCGRVNQLLKAELIAERGTRQNPGGKRAYILVAVAR